jgi:beta-1,4-glucosyltransferase
LIGVGALLDFLAGDKPRAPTLVQKLRMEWFYRLCLEPTRLLRRYTLDIGKFLALCFKQEKARKHGAHSITRESAK